MSDQVERRHDSPPRPVKENLSLDLSPYAGRWVAVVKGRVVAVGETAREALLAARYQCVKDEPSLIWIPSEGLKAKWKL